MAIIRVKKNKNYTTINNTSLKDTRLSFKAKGLMAYMLSVPDDWKFYQSELSSRATDGVSSIRSGLKELEKYGYLVRYQGRNESTGEFKEIVWDLYEMPMSDKRIPDNPISENRISDNPISVNETLLSTKGLSTEELSTNKTNASSADDLSVRFEKVWRIYPNKKGKANAFKSYCKSIKEGTTDEDIVAGIKNYVKEIEYKGTSKQYVKHGSTFLNQKGWLDDYETGPEESEVYSEYDI